MGPIGPIGPITHHSSLITRHALIVVVAPHGAPWDPVTNEELVTKFHALADRVTSRQRADAIERAVVGLDGLDDVADLIDLLAPPVAGALD